MIHHKIFEKMCLSVCAIERTDISLSELRKLKRQKDEKFNIQQTVIGTGFVVADGWVLTNRHVALAIYDGLSRRSETQFDHWFLEWIWPNKSGGFSTHLRPIELLVPLYTGPDDGGLDVALVRYSHPNNENIPIRPVRFGRLDEVRVGEDVAICGYLLGSALLHGIPGARRFGPVLHAGIISGVSPYSTAAPRNLRAILTDLNTGGGFSGSPLFSPKSGRVFGLHYRGVQGTLGIALPVDSERVSGWVSFVEENANSEGSGAAAWFTGGGDIDRSRPGPTGVVDESNE